MKKREPEVPKEKEVFKDAEKHMNELVISISNFTSKAKLKFKKDFVLSRLTVDLIRAQKRLENHIKNNYQ